MIKKVFTLAVCLGLCKCALAQPFEWAAGGGGSSGDYGNALATDNAGYSYVTGWFQNTATFGPFSLTSAGGYDIFIVKYDPAGQVVWALREGGTETDIGYGIAVDNNGNLYLAGTFKGSVGFGTVQLNSVNGSPDILVARYDTSGFLHWAIPAGSASDDQAQGICLHPFGGVYLTGYYKQTATFGSMSLSSAGQSDMFVARYDSAYTSNTPSWLRSGGGSATDNAYGITADDAGNAYATGYFDGQASFGSQVVQGPGDDDVYVVKYNASGIEEWVYSGGGSGTDRGLQLAANGDRVYFTGWFTGTAFFNAQPLVSSGLDEIFVAAIDTAVPNVVWATQAGGAGYDQGYGICTNQSGDILVTGAFDSLAQFGTTTVTSQGSWDIYVAKYTTTGSLDWVVTAGSPATNTFQRDIGYAVSTDGMDNIYFAGIIRNTAAFGPYTVASSGAQDVFVAKLSHLTHAAAGRDAPRLNAWPNPTSGWLSLSRIPAGTRNLVVRDVTGRVARTIPMPGSTGQAKLSLRGLAAGVYWLYADGASAVKVLKLSE